MNVGQAMPDFTGDTQVGEIDLHDYIDGGWAVIFTIPNFFDPVHTTVSRPTQPARRTGRALPPNHPLTPPPPRARYTHPQEYGMLSKLYDEFEQRHCKLIGVGVGSRKHARSPPPSPPRARRLHAPLTPLCPNPCSFAAVARLTVDDLDDWIQDVNLLQTCEVNFPIVADEDAEICRALGVVAHGAGRVASRFKLPVSSVLIIDIDKNIQVQTVHPTCTGHNFYETLRCLDSLQLALFHQVATPGNWKAGEDVFVLPSMNQDEAKLCFPQGFSEAKPYMRLTPQPDVQRDD
jgi:alkyl hydroperoxide reductase subunit AhpC